MTAALSLKDTQLLLCGLQPLCLPVCSQTPRWAIYFTANFPSFYWSVAPCHNQCSALLQGPEKTSQGLNKSCLVAAGEQLRQLGEEVEVTFESELSTCASWMALKCADPDGWHLLCPQLLPDHSAPKMEEAACPPTNQLMLTFGQQFDQVCYQPPRQ